MQQVRVSGPSEIESAQVIGKCSGQPQVIVYPLYELYVGARVGFSHCEIMEPAKKTPA